MPQHRTLAAGVLIVLGIAGCGQPAQVDTSDAGSSPADIAEPASWTELTVAIAEDGSVPRDLALQAFSATISPLPGVPQLQLAGSAPPGMAASRWLGRHLDALTPEQREVVESALSDGQVPTRQPLTSGVLPWPGLASLVAGPTSHVKGLVEKMAADALLGFDMAEVRLVVDVTLVDEKTVPLPQNPAVVWALLDTDSRPHACHLFVRPDHFLSAVKRGGEPEVAVHIALAMAVCRVAAGAGLDGAEFSALPAWLVEGGTLWMACRYAIDTMQYVPTLCSAFWQQYVGTRDVPLFRRSYDAVGFFGQLYEDRSDLWKAIEPSMTPDSVVAYRTLTDSVMGTFGYEWGPGQLNWSALGAAWTLEDPAAPHQTPPATEVSIHPDTRHEVKASPYTVALYSVDAAAEVITVDVDGYGRVNNLTQDWHLEGPLDLCNRPDGCTCPNAGLTWPFAGRHLVLGLTGGEAGATGTIEGSDLDAFCATVRNPDGTSTQGGLSCDRIPTEAIARITGSHLGEATTPKGFDPNPIGGQVGCVWEQSIGWSAQLFPSDLEVVPPVRQYAAACRLWLAKAAVGGNGWVACVGKNQDGYGYIDLQTARVHMLITTEPLATDVLVRVAEVIGKEAR